jgi:hypothetical protein
MRRSWNLARERGTLHAAAGEERFTKNVLERAAAVPERRAARVNEGRPLARTDTPRNRCNALMISRRSICIEIALLFSYNARERLLLLLLLQHAAAENEMHDGQQSLRARIKNRKGASEF